MGVLACLTKMERYTLASPRRAIYRAGVTQGGDILQRGRFPLFVIAGPCVIESADLCLLIAAKIKAICEKLGLAYVFKASFDKANRSSKDSFRGPGLAEGMRILEKREAGNRRPGAHGHS